MSIKSLFLTISIMMFLSHNLFAQFPDGSIAPDLTVTDIDGTTHNLYSYLDDGFTVFIDFSTTWCGACWVVHQQPHLHDLYVNHGPSGYSNVSASTSDDVMVLLVHVNNPTIDQLNGIGSGTTGDWITGTPYPIIQYLNIQDKTWDDHLTGIPTIYQICPDRTLTVVGATSWMYSDISNCSPQPSLNNDVKSLLHVDTAKFVCSMIAPEIIIQNYGLNHLTEVTIDVSVNGSQKSSTIINQFWNDSISSYQPLNLNTFQLTEVLLAPISRLVNGDVITIDINTPNSTIDSDPSNNQLITLVPTDLGSNNTFWDGQLSIDIGGSNTQTMWNIKQLNNGLQIAIGSGNVTGATNDLPLVFNECYRLSMSGTNVPYTVTDAIGNVVLDGVSSSSEDHHYFITGNELWTNVKNDNIVLENKQLIKTVDVLGRNTKEKNNTPLFYIYNDGSVEKRIIKK
jgi:hypothetical protein|tara:strand:- start:67 stop:1428 length:1362 start_codon:yes stop_codon:yes gene_type:complete